VGVVTAMIDLFKGNGCGQFRRLLDASTSGRAKGQAHCGVKPINLSGAVVVAVDQLNLPAQGVGDFKANRQPQAAARCAPGQLKTVGTGVWRSSSTDAGAAVADDQRGVVASHSRRTCKRPCGGL